MPESATLRNYSSLLFEILVATLTFAPVLLLAVFYSQLPDQIPVFLNVRGEVETWAPKSIGSVFRVPAMAVDLQLISLLMKYGTVRSHRDERHNAQHQVTMLTAQLWDWLRALVAFKMAAASLEIIFMSQESLRFLWTPAWIVTWVAAIASIIAALWYGYRIWRSKRDSGSSAKSKNENQPAREYLIGNFIYFNPRDPRLFVDTFLLNFGNRWVYVLIASLIAYPLIVFLPA